MNYGSQVSLHSVWNACCKCYSPFGWYGGLIEGEKNKNLSDHVLVFVNVTKTRNYYSFVFGVLHPTGIISLT